MRRLRGLGETLDFGVGPCLPDPFFVVVTARFVRPGSSIHWSAYPALLLAGAFAVGIVGASLLGAEALLPWIGGIGVGLVGFVGLQWWDRRRLVTLAPLGRVAAAMLIVASAGGARYALYRTPSPRTLAPVAEASSDPVSLGGVVEDSPEQTEATTRFTMTVDTVFGRDTSAVKGEVRVTLQPSPWAEDVGPFPVIRQGDVVRLRGSLRRPPGLRNPGGFNYRAYLARRGICCTMYVGTPSHVAVVGDRRNSLEAGLVAARTHVRRRIRRYVPSAGGRAVLRALLLGDRSRISDARRERFARTGLMHLLAVSGLHVFLVGMVLYTLLRPLLMRLRLTWWAVEVSRAVLTIAVLGFYMLLTGARPSVVRAVIMATLFIGGVIFQRSAHPLNTLGVAGLILLAVRPPALFDVGFQLSMAAVGSIVVLNPRFADVVPDRYRESEVGDWLISTSTVSAAAILGTAPVLLWHFGWVSAAGLLLNVAGIPCTGIALSAAIVMTVVGGVWTVAGAGFGSAADLFVRGLLATSRYGAEWFSWAGVRMPTPDWWLLGAFVAGLVALAQWPRPRNRWRWATVALMLATVSVWAGAVGRNAGPTFDLVFFDVGQGDAVLVTTPADRHVLVDTGPWSPEGGAGEFVILPYLERWGIRRLSTVVVTHPDEDHLGGLPALLREISVGRVVHNGRPADTELYAEAQRLLEREGVIQQVVQRGDTLALGPSVRGQVLGPPRRPSRRGVEGRNGLSVVLHLAYGEVDVLLPGDVEAAAERDLVRVYGDQLGSRIVKIPHHGSSTSSTRPFVGAASAKSGRSYAVVSVGRDNRYGMPSQEVLSRWQSQGMRVRSTARGGAVWVRTGGEEVWQVHWR